jgi:hypothetical protein
MCPYLVPAMADRLWMALPAVFCRRPDGSVRSPARRTILETCTSEAFTQCEGYRSATAAASPGGH